MIDQFEDLKCSFLRINSDANLTIDSAYHFQKSDLGGYIGTPIDNSQPAIWIPDLAKIRRVNPDNAIQGEELAPIHSLYWNSDKNLSLKIPCYDSTVTDIVLVQINHRNFVDNVRYLSPIESRGYFLWGSHYTLHKPSDLYQHLIHGEVFDLRYSWPHNKKCFSENEAHALYTVYSGLEKATGKEIYRFFQLQLVLSIMHRQSADGGWYHGMWTDSSECHYRLHTSGVHLLMDEFARTGCPRVKTSLEKAVAFLSKATDQLDCGVWFLHDSLELSVDAMNSGPFKWIANKSLGKSTSNMLVLNTHLDTTIAIHRYGQLTGDYQYNDLIASALKSTRAVLAMNSADWLYKPLFWAIGLTMLPTQAAMRLPLPLRAIKRFAAEYLIKKLPDIKSKYPRLVMPNGYIDRELSLRTWAVDYQTINLMDLARYANIFPGEIDESIIDNALAFTHDSGLIQRYKELSTGKRYAPGFWMEALYHRCLAKQEPIYRYWLAQAILECHDTGLGIAPSLLGCNGEAIPYSEQFSMPLTNHAEIITVNLSRLPHIELLLVNTADTNIQISGYDETSTHLNWFNSQGHPLTSDALSIKGRDWLIGKLT